MAELKLPVVEAHESPQDAIDMMKLWKRSAIVVKTGGTHSLIRAVEVRHAIDAHVQRIEHAAGLTRLAEGILYRANVPLKLLGIDVSGARLSIHDDLLPLFESAPQVCRCSHGHEGSHEGETCQEPESGQVCGRTIHCKDL
jgi:hypothetical protein